MFYMKLKLFNKLLLLRRPEYFHFLYNVNHLTFLSNKSYSSVIFF